MELTQSSYRAAADGNTKGEIQMTRMVMLWMVGVPLSVLLLMKIFGVL